MAWKSPASVQTVSGIVLGAPAVAERYFEWMTENLPGVLVAQRFDEVAMYVRGSSSPAIVLQPSTEQDDYFVYDVTGGFLVAKEPSGSFAFIKEETTLTIALRDFAPRLPAPIYLVTHHVVHAAVMSAFCRQLQPLRLEEMKA